MFEGTRKKDRHCFQQTIQPSTKAGFQLTWRFLESNEETSERPNQASARNRPERFFERAGERVGASVHNPWRAGNRLVGEAGIEPAPPSGERILSPSCMPIPPLARGENNNTGTQLFATKPT